MDHFTVLEIFQRIVSRRLDELHLKSTLGKDPESLKSIQELFFYAKFDIRFYALAADNQVEDIWTNIRNDENKLDFVMGVKAELLTFIGSSGGLRDVLAKSYAKTPKAMGGKFDFSMDEDTYDRLPSAHWIKGMLEREDWLMIMYLLHQVDFPEGFVK